MRDIKLPSNVRFKAQATTRFERALFSKLGSETVVNLRLGYTMPGITLPAKVLFREQATTVFERTLVRNQNMKPERISTRGSPNYDARQAYLRLLIPTSTLSTNSTLLTFRT
ncbi:unnamed protein product [Allacma fusca]|uniref:Uncharacterized protein n=1 Tax=Allacma fusca TaxID=39272 RepID=A0A8J2JQ36_9HEXA|nr:unnamed protein product [Allacma fusca]